MRHFSLPGIPAERLIGSVGTRGRSVANRHSLSRPGWASTSLAQRVPTLLGGMVAIVVVAVAYLRDLGRNPFGFFCDEALIGLRARRLLDGTGQDGGFSVFYDHFGTVAGALPVYATAPFVWLFGLNELSVRSASAFFMLATFAVVYRTFRLLHVAAPWLPVLVFALTPVVIHLSRVNFGHTPSLFLIALGYYLYLQGRTGRRPWLSAIGGAAMGLSAYGYPGFYVATTVFIGILAASELAFVRLRLRHARHVLVVTGAALLCLAPIFHAAWTNPDFANRFEAKDTAGYGLVSAERAGSMVQNYAKYYGADFLFETGETGLPGAFIMRHSVVGAGLLSWMSLPLLLAGLLGFLLVRDTDRERKRAFAPFVLLAFLFPLPDLLTTRSSDAPYTFAVFTGVLLIPFVVAYGLDLLVSQGEPQGSTAPARLRDSGRMRVSSLLAAIRTRIASVRTITTLVLIGAIFFLFGTYARYPLVSSDYWGWQAGPREMIGYYLDHLDQYDTFYMEGMFNESAIFLDFYIEDPRIRQDAFIGGQDHLDTSQRQLFGVSRQTFENEWNPGAWVIVHVVTYPNREIAFYLVRPAALGQASDGQYTRGGPARAP